MVGRLDVQDLDVRGKRVWEKAGGRWVYRFDAPDGGRWLAGRGDPADALGNDGDFYLDEATGRAWVKAGGSWSLATLGADRQPANMAGIKNVTDFALNWRQPASCTRRKYLTMMGMGRINSMTLVWTAGDGAPEHWAEFLLVSRTETTDEYVRFSVEFLEGNEAHWPEAIPGDEAQIWWSEPFPQLLWYTGKVYRLHEGAGSPSAPGDGGVFSATSVEVKTAPAGWSLDEGLSGDGTLYESECRIKPILNGGDLAIPSGRWRAPKRAQTGGAVNVVHRDFAGP